MHTKQAFTLSHTVSINYLVKLIKSVAQDLRQTKQSYRAEYSKDSELISQELVKDQCVL